VDHVQRVHGLSQRRACGLIGMDVSSYRYRSRRADHGWLRERLRTLASLRQNRLIGIAYPGVSGKATAFTYDGVGRRVSIASTPPGGGSAITTSYLWCGSTLCQARNASNATVRSTAGGAFFDRVSVFAREFVWIDSATVSDSLVSICINAPTAGTTQNITRRYMNAPAPPTKSLHSSREPAPVTLAPSHISSLHQRRQNE
jgi:YD repeat-containing protein